MPKPARQVGITHEHAFTDRLYDIQWIDFAHGGCAPLDEEAHPRQQECGPAREAVTVTAMNSNRV